MRERMTDPRERIEDSVTLKVSSELILLTTCIIPHVRNAGGPHIRSRAHWFDKLGIGVWRWRILSGDGRGTSPLTCDGGLFFVPVSVESEVDDEIAAVVHGLVDGLCPLDMIIDVGRYNAASCALWVDAGTDVMKDGGEEDIVDLR